MRVPKNYKDLAGHKFTRLTVICRANKPGEGRPKWICACDCGGESSVLTSNLTTGKQKSCGCLNSEMRLSRNESRKTSDSHKRELDRERKRKYNASDKGREAQRRYREANRDDVYARSKAWNSNNPEVSRTAVRNRRARIKSADGLHCRSDIELIGIEQGWKCAGCSSCIRFSYHVDHVLALSRGGGNGPDNLQLLCPTCNLKKSDRDLIDFLSEIHPELFKTSCLSGAAYVALAGEAAARGRNK